MKMIQSFFLTAILILLQFYPLAAIEAGVAGLEITPQTGLPMQGFGGRIAEDVLDPLHVRAVVFRDGTRSIGLVVYDLLYPFGEQICDQLKQRISEKTGIGQVVFGATHTHSAPKIHSAARLEHGETVEDLPEFEQMICRKTVEAVEMAFDNLVPVQIGTGWGSVDISYNRLISHPDGRVEMKWANHEKTPLGPVDQAVGVIRIDDLSGKPLAVLVNYACHPVIHGKPDANLMYSADFPGVLCREVQKQIAGNPFCIFFNGACGNLNPYYAHSVDNPKPRLEEVGNQLAAEVVRVAEKIATKPYAGESSLLYQMKHYRTGGRWDTAKGVARKNDERTREAAGRAASKKKELNLPLSAVLITPEIGFVGLPGEFFFEFQQQIRSQSPVGFLFVTGYTNGSFGYFPTIEAAARGGYGANDGAVYTAAGAGEHLVAEAIVSLNEMLGRLRPVPSSADSGYQR